MLGYVVLKAKEAYQERLALRQARKEAKHEDTRM